jgi:hypothetical protein
MKDIQEKKGEPSSHQKITSSTRIPKTDFRVKDAAANCVEASLIEEFSYLGRKEQSRGDWRTLDGMSLARKASN